MANLTYVKCDACGRLVEGSSGKCPECGAALVPAKTRNQAEHDRRPVSREPERSPERPPERSPGRAESMLPGVESMLPGGGPGPDPEPEWSPEWGPQLEDREDPGQYPEPDEKKDDGNVVWTFVSGAFSLGIGAWGVLTGDGFSVWSLLLIGVGAMAIIKGLRKMGRGSGE
jgi:hypothetical protein